MPRSFQFSPFWAAAEVWAPLPMAGRSTNRGDNSLRVFARLRPGGTLQQARAAMAVITARLERAYPGTNRDVRVVPLADEVVGGVRNALVVLLGAVGLVLLIACANVAHMQLARATTRQREVAVRTALGAGRARLVRQLLTESLVLSLAGSVLGVLLALLGVRVLVALAGTSIPRADGIGLDVRVLGFALVVSLATGLLSGLAPALQAARPDLTGGLREGARGATESVMRNHVRSVLIGSQFALALMLLVGAGLMMRSFIALRTLDPGFDPGHVVTAVVPVSGTAEASPGRRLVFFRTLLERVRALPGVASAGAINHLPIAGDIWGFPFRVEGRPRPAPGETPSATYRVIMPGYFETMRIRITSGRDISERDDVNAPGVVVINQYVAEHYWPGESPIGKRIATDRDDASGKTDWLTVVGVVPNVVHSDWAAPPEEEIYVPWLQTRFYLEGPGAHVAYLTLVVRATGDAAALEPVIRSTIGSLDPAVPVTEEQTMQSVVLAANAQPRFYLVLLVTFACVALLLAAVGIYGVISYTVSRRTHEIGIRMALGAKPGEVSRLVTSQGMVVVLVGGVAGIIGALLLTRLMRTLLYGVQPRDTLTFLLVPAVLGAVALVASWVPARRATRIDPLIALRMP